MQLNYILKSKMHFVGALGLLFGLASCGSYQYAGYEDDSIYGTSYKNVEYRAESSNVNSSSQNSNYYTSYFKEKSQELDYLSQEDVIFTDIDSYEGNYNVENDTLVDVPESYAGWGQNTTEVSINVYGGYGYGGFGYGLFGYGYPYYGHGYGYGYPYYGYGHHYSLWHWNHGYGHYGYGHNYYGNYYNNYSRRALAYNTGRRGYFNRNSGASRLNSRRTITSTRSNTFRPRRAVNFKGKTRSTTAVRPRTTIRRNTNSRITRPNVNTRYRTRSNSSSTRTPTRTRSSSTRTRSNSNFRPSSSRTSTRSSYSPSRSSSRSSGSNTSRRRRGSN